MRRCISRGRLPSVGEAQRVAVVHGKRGRSYTLRLFGQYLEEAVATKEGVDRRGKERNMPRRRKHINIQELHTAFEQRVIRHK